MDRNNDIKMRNIVSYLYLLSMFLFQGCTGSEPTKNEIVGTWAAEDNAIISFNEDGTFDTRNLPGSKIFSGFSEYKDEKFNEHGNWKLRKGQGNWIIDLDFDRSEKVESGFATQMSISGEGLSENKPPWYLFIWIGDPDDMNKYKFVKQ